MRIFCRNRDKRASGNFCCDYSFIREYILKHYGALLVLLSFLKWVGNLSKEVIFILELSLFVFYNPGIDTKRCLTPNKLLYALVTLHRTIETNTLEFLGLNGDWKNTQEKNWTTQRLRLATRQCVDKTAECQLQVQKDCINKWKKNMRHRQRRAKAELQDSASVRSIQSVKVCLILCFI